MSAEKHSHYFKSVAHLEQIDVYRVCDLFGVCPTVAHAVKKLLVSGGRGPKGQRQDLQEAIDTLQRKLAMMHEDELLPTETHRHLPLGGVEKEIADES